ncbi:uncharacterized protein VTP21DRAFT_9945 [Calcarisporiella thermophila]|uniref:uncharacterized protein n=1 Tax=Calcarisporiella thermophila TaxID=911321 RepID=UPI0037444E18
MADDPKTSELESGVHEEDDWGEIEGGEDGFGDFGDFGGGEDNFDEFTDFAEPTIHETPDPVFVQPLPAAKHLDFQLGARDIALEFVDALESIFPETTQMAPSLSEMRETRSELAAARHHILCTDAARNLWERFSADTVFYNPLSHTRGQFRWQRSHIQKAYLEALDVRVQWKEKPKLDSPTEKQQQSPLLPSESTLPKETAKQVVASPTMVTRESDKDIDLAEAKQLCELSRDELKQKSLQELTEIRDAMLDWTRRINDSLTYWLDQREQATMDSETYNHLIGCILGHAQKRVSRKSGENWDAGISSAIRRKKNGSSVLGLSGWRKGTSSGSSTGGRTSPLPASNSGSMAPTSPSPAAEADDATRRLSM